MSLHGATCVVTGASRGLGRRIAEHLAAAGARIAVCARDLDALEALGTSLETAHGTEVLTARVDVSDAASVAAFAEASAARLGPARVLVNNAGMLGPVGPVDEVDLTAWGDALAVNVLGTVHACASFVPQLRVAGGGSIVNLSGAGLGGPGVPARISAYVASKAAVVVLTEALANELAPDGVRVNAVAPGPVATGFGSAILAGGAELAGTDLYETTLGQQDQLDAVPDFYELVEYLASDESRWLTGKLLSARWDPVAELREARPGLEGTSALTLRRIDGDLFREA